MNWSFSAHNSLCKSLIKSNQIYEVNHALPILLFIFDPNCHKVMPRFLLIHISYELLLKLLLRLFVCRNLCPNYFMHHLVFKQLERRNTDRSALKKLTREAALLETRPSGSGQTEICVLKRKAQSSQFLFVRTQWCLMIGNQKCFARQPLRSCFGKFDSEGQMKERLSDTHMSFQDCWNSWFWFIYRQVGPCVCLAFRCQQFW